MAASNITGGFKYWFDGLPLTRAPKTTAGTSSVKLWFDGLPHVSNESNALDPGLPATKFYLTDTAAVYTPATIRGTWSDSASVVTKALAPNKVAGGEITSVVVAETSLSGSWTVLLYRGVSGPLGAQTIAGNVDVRIGVSQSSDLGDFCYRLHIYVTQGDSDTPRGTLLSNYSDGAAGSNEWNQTVQLGLGLVGVQALSSLAISAGDRIVVEIGYIARNVSSTSRSGTLRYGTLDSAGFPVDDTNYGTAGTTTAGFILFDSVLTEQAFAFRLSQMPVEVLVQSTTTEARLSQEVVEVLSTSAAFSARLTQIAVEVLVPNVLPPSGGSGIGAGMGDFIGADVWIE